MNVWLNRLVPDFTLPNVLGGRISLSDWRGQIIVVNFWSAECPWSKRADVLLVYRQPAWEKKGVRIVGVASNLTEPETEILYEIQIRQVRYPIAIDDGHRIADLYKADTTPHFFVLDRQGIARYIGALDDATAEARDPKVIYLDRAIAAMLDNREPDPAWTPAYGCVIVRQPGMASNVPVPIEPRK